MAKLLKTWYQVSVNNFLAMVVVAFVAATLRRAWPGSTDDLACYLRTVRPGHILTAVILTAGVAQLRRLHRLQDMYLVEYGCFRPKPCFRTPFATCLEYVHLMPYLIDDQSVSFAIWLLERSGIDEETCLPYSYHYMPPDRSLQAAREEMELVIFSAVDEVFARTSVRPKEIDVLIINCSILINTTLMFVDMVVNRYRLRADVQCNTQVFTTS